MREVDRIRELPPREILPLVLSTEDPSELEAIGRSLTVPQCLELFGALTNALKRLKPIVMGLSRETFRRAVREGEPEHLQALKQQGMAEPLQHQLALVLRDIEADQDRLSLRYIELETAIDDAEDPKTLWQELCSLSASYLDLMEEASRLLLLAWNADRYDLIERLTDLKEGCHRISRVGVGFPETESEKATGLFRQLLKPL